MFVRRAFIVGYLCISMLGKDVLLLLDVILRGVVSDTVFWGGSCCIDTFPFPCYNFANLLNLTSQ
jgi:hypothetical protein